MKTIQRIIKGCGDMPHVGPHPGTTILAVFIAMGAAAGHRGGVYGLLGGAAFMALFIVPLYLYGAYDRAVLSEKLTREADGLEQKTSTISLEKNT